MYAMAVETLQTAQPVELTMPALNRLLPLWTFVAVQTLRTPERKFKAYGTVRSAFNSPEAAKLFPEIDFSVLPTALYGVGTDREAGGISIDHVIQADTGKITKLPVAETKGRQIFSRVTKVGYMYQPFDLAKGPEQETPAVAVKKDLLAERSHTTGFGVPYDLFQDKLLWDDELLQKGFTELANSLHNEQEIQKLAALNSFLTASTGLNLFEMCQALTHIYYNDAPEDPAQSIFAASDDFVAARTGLDPKLISVILGIAHPDWNAMPRVETPLLLPPGEMPVVDPQIQKVRELIHAGQDRWLAAIDDPKALETLVDEATANGLSKKQVKREAALMLLTLNPGRNIQNMLMNLHTDTNSVTLADLPVWAVAAREKLNKQKSRDPQNPNIALVTDPATGFKVRMNDWIMRHRENISSGIISIAQIRSLFEPELTKESVYNHLRRAFSKDEYARIKGIPKADREQWYGELFTGWAAALRAGQFEAVTTLARRLRIDKDGLNGYFSGRLEQDAGLKELRDQAIGRSRTRSIMESGVELGGVHYDSYREAMLSMLLMLYQNYLPLNGINFQTAHTDKGGSLRRVDFRLLATDPESIQPVSRVYVEYGPAISRRTTDGREFVRHGGNQEAYLDERKALVAGVPNSRLSGVANLMEFPEFLEREFGIVLEPEVAKRIGTFEHKKVEVGDSGKVNLSEGISILFSFPELVKEIFNPGLRGMLNVFARNLGSDKEVVSKIRGLYPDIPEAEFDQTVAVVRARLEFPRALLNKMQRSRNYITELRASQRV